MSPTCSTDPVDVEADRSLMLGVAYRMLGSRADAADAVQEAFSRWYAQPASVQQTIVSPTAWLVTTVSRICLDVLKSARARRERAVGSWLPEPLPSTDPLTSSLSHVDPEHRIAVDESVTTALLVIMDTMSPAERVAFVLHDVFGYRFAEIATVTGRTPGACRQLASAARRKARAKRPPVGDRWTGTLEVAALKAAWDQQNIVAMVALLDPDAVAVVDSGGLVSAPPEPAVGSAAVAHMLIDVLDRAPDLQLSEAQVNNGPGLVARDAFGAVLAVIAVVVETGRISRILVTRDPRKLTAWS